MKSNPTESPTTKTNWATLATLLLLMWWAKALNQNEGQMLRNLGYL